MKRDGEDGGTFDRGIEQVVAAVLVSPQFLYRAIRGPKDVAPDTESRLRIWNSLRGFPSSCGTLAPTKNS